MTESSPEPQEIRPSKQNGRIKYINSIDDKEKKDTSNLSPSGALSKFEAFIKRYAKEIAKDKVKTHPNWFANLKKTLMSHIKLCNHVQKQYHISSTDDNHHELKRICADLQRVK